MVAIWIIFGSPKKDIANWFYKESAAPWETVDAFYYPDKNDLNALKMMYGLNSVQACRDWVYREAAANGDAKLLKGDYECGIGRLSNEHYGIPIYRTDTR